MHENHCIIVMNGHDTERYTFPLEWKRTGENFRLRDQWNAGGINAKCEGHGGKCQRMIESPRYHTLRG